MKRDNIDERKKKIQNEIESPGADLIRELELLSRLPGSLPAPTLSSIGSKPHRGWAGTISFSNPTHLDDGSWDPVWIAGRIADTVRVMPASLAFYGNYRRCTYPALCEDVPDMDNGDTLKNVEAIAPVWIDDIGSYRQEANFFVEIAGRIHKVSIEIPKHAYASARRVEFRGGWRYEGQVKIGFPKHWHELSVPTGDSSVEQQATLSAHECVRIEHDRQSLSGELFWQCLIDQAEATKILRPDAVLHYLLKEPEASQPNVPEAT